MPNTQPIAIVLLSGGLDSATTAAIARHEGYDVRAISFRYGQRHAVELAAAAKVATSLCLSDHRIVDVDLRAFGGSALTADIEVPRNRDSVEMRCGIPITYIPARNTIFLSFALALAEVSGAEAIFLGVNSIDYSGYPDCRPEFLAAFQELACLATKAGVEGQPMKICAPLISMTKAEIIRTGLRLGVDYSLTSSCYSPDEGGAACGECDSCQIRLQGFAQVGSADPIPYLVRSVA